MRGSTITGPVIIGAGSLVENCRIGPHVAVGRGCELRGTRVTDSIVLDGTALTAGPDLGGALLSPDAAHSILGPTVTGSG